MKIIVAILSCLVLTAQVRIHVDVIAFDNIDLHEIVTSNNFTNNHQLEHHQHESDDEKNSEHHHHCVDISVLTLFLASNNDYSLKNIPQENRHFPFYKGNQGTNFLASVFQPPKV